MPQPEQQSKGLLFRIAFSRKRPFYCYGCICLTLDERAYQRRVFRLASAWAKVLREERLLTNR